MLFSRLKVELCGDYVIGIKFCVRRLGFIAYLIRMNG